MIPAQSRQVHSWMVGDFRWRELELGTHPSTGRTSDTHPQPTTYIQRHLALSSVKVSPSRMDRITILLLLGGILVTCAQKPRFFKTKFDDCGKIRISFLELEKKTSDRLFPGSLLDIAPALEGSVKMTAPFNRATGRHVLGKVAWKIHKHNFDLLRELGAYQLY